MYNRFSNCLNTFQVILLRTMWVLQCFDDYWTGEFESDD